MYCKTAQAALVTVLLSVPTFGQEWATKMFATTSHDFGTVARGQRTEFEFVLENLYVEDVHIASVRASCQLHDAGDQDRDVENAPEGGHPRQVQHCRLPRTQGRDANGDFRQALLG